jgi:hypothetical protein
VLAAVAALTATFWVPLVVGVLGGAAAQGHYLSPDFLDVAVGFNGPPELIVLTIAAVAALVLGHAWTASRAVVALLVAAVGYQLLSLASLFLTDNQLQPHRAVTMLWATLGAAVPVALEGFARPGSLARGLPPAGARAAAIVVAVVATGATFVLGARQGTDLATGPLTVGAHDPMDMQTPREISRFITHTTGRPPQDLTLLSGDNSAVHDNAVLITHPYIGYLALRARYAHPQAQLPRRVRAIQRAAACRSAACATRALTRTPFGRVDAIVLTRIPTGLQLLTQVDAFPAPRLITIVFRPDQLDPAVWASRTWGEVVVFARRP